jgi:hypothetical protein
MPCPPPLPCVCNTSTPVCQCHFPDEVGCATDLEKAKLLRELITNVRDMKRDVQASGEKLTDAAIVGKRFQDDWEVFQATHQQTAYWTSYMKT